MNIGYFSISTSLPHAVPVEKCKGSLKDPTAEYQELAYWHGTGDFGWFSKPIPSVEYIKCEDQKLSLFLVDREIAQKFGLKEKV